MKELDIVEASILDYGGRLYGLYERELRDFMRTDASACELLVPNGVSADSAAEGYRKAASRKNHPVHIARRGTRVIAFKKDAYETLMDDFRSELYANRILKEVAETEELAKISGEYEF